MSSRLQRRACPVRPVRCTVPVMGGHAGQGVRCFSRLRPKLPGARCSGGSSAVRPAQSRLCAQKNHSWVDADLQASTRMAPPIRRSAGRCAGTELCPRTRRPESRAGYLCTPARPSAPRCPRGGTVVALRSVQDRATGSSAARALPRRSWRPLANTRGRAKDRYARSPHPGSGAALTSTCASSTRSGGTHDWDTRPLTTS